MSDPHLDVTSEDANRLTKARTLDATIRALPLAPNDEEGVIEAIDVLAPDCSILSTRIRVLFDMLELTFAQLDDETRRALLDRWAAESLMLRSTDDHHGV